MTQTDALDRKAVASARQYMGGVAWPTIVLGVVLGVSYVGTVVLALAGTLPLWLAVPLLSFLVYLSYTVLHESVHGSITGSNESLRWLNKALGYMAAWIVMIPLTAHRHEHIAHHRHANNEHNDPDFHVGGMRNSLSAAIVAVLQAWVGQFTFYAKNRWAKAPKRQNVVLCMEVAAALLPRLAVMAAGYWVEGLALFLVAWSIGVTVLMFLFAYIVHSPHETEGRFVDTSTILVPGGALGKVITVAWVYPVSYTHLTLPTITSGCRSRWSPYH